MLPLGVGDIADDGDEIAGLDDVADVNADRGHRSGYLGEHRNLHLHGFQEDDGVALVDVVAFADHDLEHTGHDLSANVLGHLHPLVSRAAPAVSIEPHARDWNAAARA